MKKNNFKIWKIIFLVLILAGLAVNSFISQKADAAEEETLVNYKELDEIEDIVEKYHEALNEEMNRRIDLLLKIKSGELKESSKKKCEEDKDSVATFCLAQVFVKEYFVMRKALLEKRNEFVLKAQEGAKKQKTPEELLRNIKKQDMLVDRELAIAEKAMKLALSAYNELHLAYPLHLKYQKLIETLEGYRGAIRDIRHKVDFFPNTFFNVSTPNCT